MTIQIIRDYIQKNLILVIFFVFLSVSLFLGDSKDSFIVVFWGLGILTLYATGYYQKRVLARGSSRLIGVSWTVFLIYCVIRTIFSDSVAYSLIATTRFIEAYLLFQLFISLASEKTIELFSKWLVFTGAVVIVIAWIFMAFPNSAHFLPLMNLLYANYGHSHLADLLILIFPLLIVQIQSGSSKSSRFLLVIYVLGLVSTFARGAWIIVIGYLFFLLMARRKDLTRKRLLFFATISVLGIALIGITANSQFHLKWQAPTSGYIWRQLMKPPIAEDKRVKYWGQAIAAVGQRPWFGSGPGTFLLESKFFQEKEGEFSWFAHNVVLQYTAEVGVVGTILLFFLAVIYTSSLRVRSLGGYEKALVWSILLTLFYSIYEFNLDYLVIALLLSAVAGLLVRPVEAIYYIPKQVGVLLVYLFIFYLSFVAGQVMVYTNNKPMAFFLAPYNIDYAIGMLEDLSQKNLTPTPAERLLLDVFYKSDSEVAFELADVLEKAHSLDEAARLYKRALYLDPHNSSYYSHYFLFLSKQKNFDALASELKRIGLRDARAQYRDEIMKIDFQSPYLMAVYEGNIFDKTRNFSQIYYLLGLGVMKQDIWLTYWLWHAARDLYPDLGTYHLELASLEYYEFGNQEASMKILDDCLQYTSPARECYEGKLFGLLPPGGFDEFISSL